MRKTTKRPMIAIVRVRGNDEAGYDEYDYQLAANSYEELRQHYIRHGDNPNALYIALASLLPAKEA